MKTFYSILICCLFSLSSSAQLTFDGLTSNPISLKPESNTGLEMLYVIEYEDGATISYQASSENAIVQWDSYSKLGGGYCQPLQFTREGAKCTVKLNIDDIGFIITDNSRQHCFWITNYNNHQLTLSNVTLNAEDSDCDMTYMSILGEAMPITYYTVTGIPRELSRNISISYNTLIWDDNSLNFNQIYQTQEISSISGTSIRVPAPLCNTDFTITGDRFLEKWGKPITIITPTYEAKAIDAHTTATMAARDNDNEITVNNGELGGSAPVDITFSAVTSDAVAYREWQISQSADFDIIDLRYNQNEVEYTFNDFGTFYVRFIAANANADCDWTSDTYQVSIGESKIDCPNAFSPGSSEGTNDIWKVSYKSITQFECHIFNHWGIKLFSTTDPSQGWDGKHNGKLVPAGVYYYVIKAHGADGKNYSLSGDINIINHKKGSNRNTSYE